MSFRVESAAPSTAQYWHPQLALQSRSQK